MLRVLQCVAPRGWLSSVCTMTLATFASSILRGTPGRGSSSSPSMPRSTKRRCHLPTVCTVTRSRAATALLLKPEAQPNTMRARNAKACPSCVGAYSLPRYPQPQPTVRSWLPDDPFASPALTPMHFVSSNYHTNFRLSTLAGRSLSCDTRLDEQPRKKSTDHDAARVRLHCPHLRCDRQFGARYSFCSNFGQPGRRAFTILAYH